MTNHIGMAIKKERDKLKETKFINEINYGRLERDPSTNEAKWHFKRRPYSVENHTRGEKAENKGKEL